jgi:hypothetical protein
VQLFWPVQLSLPLLSLLEQLSSLLRLFLGLVFLQLPSFSP